MHGKRKNDIMVGRLLKDVCCNKNKTKIKTLSILGTCCYEKGSIYITSKNFHLKKRKEGQKEKLY